MGVKPEVQEKTILARWIYTHEEWRNFERWVKKRRSFFHYLLHRLLPRQKAACPEVTITGNNVCINNVKQPFNDKRRQLRRIQICDAGQMNVIEITYTSEESAAGLINEIKIPVPKGKLREAIELQQKLAAGAREGE